MPADIKQINASSRLIIPENGPVLLQFREWADEDVSHAFTTRRSTRGDVVEPDMMNHPESDPDHVRRSRKAVLRSDLLPEHPIIRPEQVHGGNAQWVTTDQARDANQNVTIIPNVDGLLTRSDRVLLMAHSADCPIVFLYASGGDGVAGLLHASWKGISYGIPRTGVRRILERTSVDASRLRAGISPSIHPCCYEVKSNFRSTMLEREPITRPCFLNREDKLFFDLQQAIERQLEDAGLSSEQIVDAAQCSHCRKDLYYSYRRNGVTTGRTAGLISLNGTN